MNRKSWRILAGSLLALLCVSAYAEVRFHGTDLSEDDYLLFGATADSPGKGSYDVLFMADLTNDSIRQLTFFPENIMMLNQSDQLQIQNRFGVFRTDSNLDTMQPIKDFPAFVNGYPVQTGKINPAAASPDGMYLLFFRSSSFGHASLTLYDISEEREYVITENVELSLEGPGAAWSPDSKFFVYAKGGQLYYYSITQLTEDRLIAEKFRNLGEGDISSARWSAYNDLYYISGNLVYQISSTEFFTRSLYADLLEIGTIVGKIPFEFDPNFDSFWISPSGNTILLNKSGRSLFLYYLKADDFASTGDVKALPYLLLPRNTRVKRILWSSRDVITVLTGSLVKGNTETTLFRLDLEGIGTEDDVPAFTQTADDHVRDVVLSSDQLHVAVVKENSVTIRDYANWIDIKSLYHSSPLTAVWRSNDEVIVSGSFITESYNMTTKESRLICFSQVDSYGFIESAEAATSAGEEGASYPDIGVRVLGEEYRYRGESGWRSADSMTLKPAGVSSGSYRVYLELLSTGSYRNMVMIRDITGFGTSNLFSYPETQYEPFPESEEAVSFDNFRHGSRIRRREVALTFDAVDSVEGLTEILNVLAEYQLRGTFFINGEFIRRNPEAVREIAESGHEVGSMFYVYFNMTDARFKMDADFIKRGLARNEDDYFAVTGREVSLLWHAPYYFVNNDIISASRDMNYVYVGRDVDPLDWVAAGECGSVGSLYMSSSKIIERIMRLKKPGSIISIRVGVPRDERHDYLFHKLDVLINGLISLGYDIVPVSALIEHAR